MITPSEQERGRGIIVFILINILVPIIVAYIPGFSEKKTAIKLTDFNLNAFLLSLIATFLIDLLVYSKKEIPKLRTELDKLSTNINTEVARILFNGVEKDLKSFDAYINAYNREFSQKCLMKDCQRLIAGKKCKLDCLLMAFIKEDINIFKQSLDELKEGKYKLDKAIKEYHTIAIKQLRLQSITRFKVIHYINGNNDGDEYDEHFMDTLLNDGLRLDVDWIFVGDLKNTNSFNYLHKYLSRRQNNVNFNFSNINMQAFNYVFDRNKAKLSKYIAEHAPNIGIYGQEFFFTQNGNGHGYFHVGEPVIVVNSFFDELGKHQGVIRLKYDQNQFVQA